MDVKKNIRKIREKHEYSQEYVAAQLGITQQAYQQIETGDTKVTVELLVSLSLILHVRVEEFFGVEPRNEPESHIAGSERLWIERLIDIQNRLNETKDQVIASKDKVIELLQSSKAKPKRKKRYKRA